MDSGDLYDELKAVDASLADSAKRFSAVHKSLIKMMEENMELKIENQHLHERIDELSSSKKSRSKSDLSESRKNLENLYNEGFHVCNAYFGKRRKNGEVCIFCTDIIYGRH